MDGKSDRDQLRDRSKLLLGSRHQAEIGAAIDEFQGPIWGRGLLKKLELEDEAKGMVSTELKRLEKAGLVVPAPASDFDRRRLLEPADSNNPYWALCRQMRDTPLS